MGQGQKNEHQKSKPIPTHHQDDYSGCEGYASRRVRHSMGRNRGGIAG